MSQLSNLNPDKHQKLNLNKEYSLCMSSQVIIIFFNISKDTNNLFIIWLAMYCMNEWEIKFSFC